MEIKLILPVNPGAPCLMEFEIEEAGLVISRQAQEEISRTIIRESSDINRRSGEKGFGLAITRRLLELLDTKMMLEDQNIAGGEFHFRVQLQKPEKPEEMNDSSNPKSGTDPGTVLPNSKILMVEDNPLNVFVGTKFLQKWGVDIHVAENGRVALEMLATDSFDLILMDLQMPEMDGYETTQRIRLFDDLRKASVPILAISAAAEKHIRDKAFESGMNDFVFKPFNPEELQIKLTKYLLLRRAS